MTVRELITELLRHNMNHQVIVASDAEGNRFSRVYAELGSGHYDSGDYNGECEDDQINAVCLWPI